MENNNNKSVKKYPLQSYSAWEAIPRNEFDDDGLAYDWLHSSQNAMIRSINKGINFDLLNELCENVSDEIVSVGHIDSQEEELISFQSEVPFIDRDLEDNFVVELDHYEERSSVLVSSVPYDDAISSYVKTLPTAIIPLPILKRFGNRTKFEFPGTMFAPVRHCDLPSINDSTHALSVKLNGQRCMMIVQGRNIILVMRNGAVRSLGMLSIPYSEKIQWFDCELIWSSGHIYVVILDICMYNSEYVGSTFKARRILVTGFVSCYKKEGFRVLCQQYYSVGRLNLLSDSFDNEGFVFTPINGKYTFGFSRKHFSWKRKGETVDFKILANGVGYGLGVLSRDLTHCNLVAEIDMDDRYDIGDIIEFNVKDGIYSYSRHRNDKMNPNSCDIYEQIILSKVVTLCDLYKYFSRYCVYLHGKYDFSLYKLKGFEPKVAYSKRYGIKCLLYGRKTSDWYDFNQFVDNKPLDLSFADHLFADSKKKEDEFLKRDRNSFLPAEDIRDVCMGFVHRRDVAIRELIVQRSKLDL